MLHVTQVDVTMFAQSLRTQGTPWAAGCADILESLWQECEDSRYADIEHEQLGCHVAKTGIYAVSATVTHDEIHATVEAMYQGANPTQVLREFMASKGVPTDGGSDK